MISKTFITQLCNQIRIEDYIGSQIPLQKKEKTFRGSCPFCGKKSFVVYPETHSFYCYACRVGGDLITYVQKTEKQSYREAVRTLAAYAEMEMPKDVDTLEENEKRREIMRQAALFYHHQLRSNPKAKMAIDVLHTWGLHGKTIVSLGIGFHDDSFQALVNYADEKRVKRTALKELHCIRNTNGGDYDAMRNSIIIPTVDPSGEVLAFDSFCLEKQQWLYYPKTECFDRKKCLYGLNLAIKSQNKTVIVVSSYLDYFRLVGLGIKNVVFSYLPQLSGEQAELLQKNFRMVLLWLPNYVSKSSYRVECKRLRMMCEDLPLSDCETPSDYLLKHGPESIKVKMNTFEKYLADELF